MLLGCVALAAPAVAVSAQAEQGIDACALLQPMEMERVLVGHSVAPGVRNDAGLESNGAYSSTCMWMLRSEGAPAAQQAARGRSYVILNVMQWPAGSGKAGSFLESFREAKEAGVLTAPLVPKSFGDEALWWGDGLAVRRRDISFGLSVVVAGGGVRGVNEERLAPHVLRRIDTRDAQLGRDRPR
jgi:hypothetical protein